MLAKLRYKLLTFVENFSKTIVLSGREIVAQLKDNLVSLLPPQNCTRNIEKVDK